MGAHKYNPVAQQAKEGLLPPKKPKLSSKEKEILFFEELKNRFEEKLGTPFMDLPSYQRDIFKNNVRSVAKEEARQLLEKEGVTDWNEKPIPKTQDVVLQEEI